MHSVIRVPIGAYGSGGPYHSSSIESVLTAIRGIKVAYPSCGADLKGLLKSAVDDPNPVVVLEHKGLYWSKVPGTEAAKTIEPNADYRLPFGKARIVQPWAMTSKAKSTLAVITYVRGVHWALEASKAWPGRVEILDLRSLSPVDESAMLDSAKRCHRCLVLTEEPPLGSFAQALAGLISDQASSNTSTPPCAHWAPWRCRPSRSTRPSKPLSSPMPPRWLQPSRSCSFTEFIPPERTSGPKASKRADFR